MKMTTKGYVNDFYRQFEELNKKLDKANNTIFSMSLTISDDTRRTIDTCMKFIHPMTDKIVPIIIKKDNYKKIF